MTATVQTTNERTIEDMRDVIETELGFLSEGTGLGYEINDGDRTIIDNLLRCFSRNSREGYADVPDPETNPVAWANASNARMAVAAKAIQTAEFTPALADTMALLHLLAKSLDIVTEDIEVAIADLLLCGTLGRPFTQEQIEHTTGAYQRATRRIGLKQDLIETPRGIAVFAHELGHACLFDTGLSHSLTNHPKAGISYTEMMEARQELESMEELAAETIACLFCAHVGLDTTDYSSRYMSLYFGNDINSVEETEGTNIGLRAIARGIFVSRFVIEAFKAVVEAREEFEAIFALSDKQQTEDAAITADAEAMLEYFAEQIRTCPKGADTFAA